MWAMDGIWSCKVWPYYLPFPPKPSAIAPPFSANGVSVQSADLAEFEEASASNNSPYGSNSFSKPLGELDSAPFSKSCSHGYSGFQFMDPPSSRLTRVSSPDWPREIEHPCQSPSLWNQFLEFNKGHVKGSDDDGALDSSLFSKIKEAWNVPIFKARPRIPNPRTNLDECNPAVYSPCWNGAPAAHSSLCEAYEALHPELVDKIDECLASYLEGPKDFHVEIAKYGRESCGTSNKNKMQNEIGSQEQGLTGLVTKFSVSNSVSQECNSDGVGNDGRSDVRKQVIEENEFISQNQNSLCRCKDIGFNVSECLECSSSQKAEIGLSSPSSIAGGSEKGSASVPAPKIEIQMLVKMMNNMSELLLYHCLTDEFQLNERDRSILENVTSNLRTCTLKDAEQMIPAQKRLFPELHTGNFGGQSPQLQQAMTSVLSENFLEEEESASHTVPYKNLWVEAEAELCSLIYRARFNRMNEVEKYSSKHGDNALEKGEQSKKEQSDQNSAKEVNSSHSAEHISAIHAASLTELSGLGLCSNPNETIASQHEGEGSQKVDNSTVFDTNKEAEHHEASVLASFQALIDKDLSNSADSLARDMALVLAFEGTDSPKTRNHGRNASESLSLMDDTDPETLDSSDADVKESDLDLEDNQEIQHDSCHRFGNELITDDSDDSLLDWELV